jgi:glyoxylase I family protein
MPLTLTKDSIDLGLVTNNPDAALTFYRDTVGLEHVGELNPMPGTSVQQLLCGSSMIKIIYNEATPPGVSPAGGPQDATGYRYWTMFVTDLQDVFDRCVAAGAKVAIPVTEFRPGLSIAIVEDPDGNWVEFVQETS